MEKQIIAVIMPEKKSTRYDDNASCSLEKLNILIQPNLKFRREVIQKLNNSLRVSQVIKRLGDKSQQVRCTVST